MAMDGGGRTRFGTVDCAEVRVLNVDSYGESDRKFGSGDESGVDERDTPGDICVALSGILRI